MTATVGLEGGHFFIVITRMVTKISITTTVVRSIMYSLPPVSGIGTERKGTSRFPETKVARGNERTNRLSRGGRDNSLGSAASAADFVILSYCFCFDKQFFCDQDLQSEKRQPSLGKVTVVKVKPDIHS